MFFVYILRSQKNGRYYIGSAKDLNQRLEQHNSGATKSTRNSRPWQLVHTEGYETLIKARNRESQIKSWKNRAYMADMLGLTE